MKRYKSYNHFGAGDIPMSSSRFSTLMSQTPAQTMVPWHVLRVVGETIGHSAATLKEHLGA